MSKRLNNLRKDRQNTPLEYLEKKFKNKCGITDVKSRFDHSKDYDPKHKVSLILIK